MTWKRQRTTIDIDAEADLSDFSSSQLLQGLIDAKLISEAEAEAIERRAKESEKSSLHVVADDEGLDVAYLEDARLAIARGKKDDAIHYIEHFLGREWIGRLQ